MSFPFWLTQGNDSQDGEFQWTTIQQSYILSSFFYGYVLTQIPFGMLAKRFGSMGFLGWGMLLNSVFAFLVPFAARQNLFWLCVVRFIQGLGEGPIVPCTHAMLAKWVPPNERSRMGAAVYAGKHAFGASRTRILFSTSLRPLSDAGAQFGTIISMPLSGLLAEYGYDGGWPSIFYVFGMVGVIWSIAFIWLVYEDPSSHPRIEEKEKKYIISSLYGTAAITVSQALAAGKRRPNTQPDNDFWFHCSPFDRVHPFHIKVLWLRCRSTPFCSLTWDRISATRLSWPNCRHTWSKCSVSRSKRWVLRGSRHQIPTRIDINWFIWQNGVLSALPYLAMWLFSMFISVIADWMIYSGRFTHTRTRKIINSIGEYRIRVRTANRAWVVINRFISLVKTNFIGQYSPAICLIIASYTGCDRVTTVALLTLGVGLNGGIYSGFKINHLDITPRFAGILMAFTNCTANLAGLLAPIVAGHLIHGKVSICDFPAGLCSHPPHSPPPNANWTLSYLPLCSRRCTSGK